MASGPAEAAGGGTFPPFDPATFPSQIFWLAVTFGLLYFVLKTVGLPRVSAILEARQQRLTNDRDVAKRLQSESDEVKSGYEAALADAKRNAQELAQKSRDQAKADADAAREKAESSLQEKLAAAEASIAATTAAAMVNVGGIAESVAQDVANSVLNMSVSEADMKSAVSKALES